MTAPSSPPRPAPTTPVPGVGTRAPAPAGPAVRRSNPVPVLAALTVLFFITTLLFGWMAFSPSSSPVKPPAVQQAAESASEDEIREVASNFTESLLTYNFQSADADIAKALRFATDEFPTRSLAAFGGSDITKVKSDIKAHRGTSSVDVKAAAITSRDDDTATVVVVTNRTFDSDRSDGEGLLVIELTLVNTSDGWKVDNVASPAPTS